MKFPGKIKSLIKRQGLDYWYYGNRKKLSTLYAGFLLKISPERYAVSRYKSIYGKKPNLKKPVTFDEKLIWMNLFWRHPLKTECADKYTLRSYIQKHKFEHILPKLIGVYKKSDEINFDQLPSKFVLKCTHGSGFNIICTDKQLLDKCEAKRKLDKWMSVDYSKYVGELHYADIKPLIICEEFLDGIDNTLPTDFKLFCFNGKVQYICEIQGRDLEGHAHLINFFDNEWKTALPYYTSVSPLETIPNKPESFDEMIAIAETLSKPFPFVRIDFYNIKGKAVLGEMTFTPVGCINNQYTDTAQISIGSLIELPDRIYF